MVLVQRLVKQEVWQTQQDILHYWLLVVVGEPLLVMAHHTYKANRLGQFMQKQMQILLQQMVRQDKEQ